MSISTECGLIIFLRLPEFGKVKTRIASTLGDEVALEVYKELTTLTLNLASSLVIPVYLFYEGGLPQPAEQISTFEYVHQTSGNLGNKMRHAFEIVLQKHKKAVIIGSDCPDLAKDDIMSAFDQLDRHDLVIGPSEDGGYYLLGCKTLAPFLFTDLPWSSSLLFNETIARIESHQMSCHVLRQLYDIDEEAEWTRFRNSRIF